MLVTEIHTPPFYEATADMVHHPIMLLLQLVPARD